MKTQEVELGSSLSHKQYPEWKEKHAVSPSRCASQGGSDLNSAVALQHRNTHTHTLEVSNYSTSEQKGFSVFVEKDCIITWNRKRIGVSLCVHSCIWECAKGQNKLSQRNGCLQINNEAAKKKKNKVWKRQYFIYNERKSLINYFAGFTRRDNFGSVSQSLESFL